MASRQGLDEDTKQTLGLLQAQLRAQAREIASLQRQVVDIKRERDQLAGKVLKPLNERFADCVKDLVKETCWFRLKSVEEVIDDHYARQIDRLGEDEAELRQTLSEFRADEQAHRDLGLAEGAEEAPGYEPLTAAIKAGSRLAIWLSERV